MALFAKRRGGCRLLAARGPVVWILAFALALGGCGVGEWWGGLRTYRLAVTSAPAGADVYVNGVHQGKTPLIITYQVQVGDVLRGFEIRIERDGYLSIRREVPFDAGNLHFRLVRPRIP